MGGVAPWVTFQTHSTSQGKDPSTVERNTQTLSRVSLVEAELPTMATMFGTEGVWMNKMGTGERACRSDHVRKS